MAGDNFQEMVDLVDNVRLLKNQQENSLKEQQEQLKDFLNTEREKSKDILAEQKKILKELKQAKHKTYSKYFLVGAGCFAVGLALATFGCFTFSNWLNYDQITTSNNLKIQQEQLAKEKLELAAVKNKYDKFDQFYELVSLLAEFNSKDEKAVTIWHGTNYLEKTLKDKKEDVLVLSIKSKFLTECVTDNQKCYSESDNKQSGYFGIGLTKNGTYIFTMKKP